MRMQKICFIHPIGKQLNHTRTLIVCKYTFAQLHLTSQNYQKITPKSMEKCSKIIIEMNIELKYFLASFLNWFLSILDSLTEAILDHFFIKMEGPQLGLFMLGWTWECWRRWPRRAATWTPQEEPRSSKIALFKLECMCFLILAPSCIHLAPSSSQRRFKLYTLNLRC